LSRHGNDLELQFGLVELLGAILKQATGKPLDQLARTELFEPLGITDVE
jgi:CubicO group peptidase (beta-lactamase class C family)